MFVPFGARRRRPFLRECPNGFVLRVEVGTLDPLALSMLPSPSKVWFLCGWSSEGLLRNPPSVATWSRSGRDGLACRDKIMTLLGVATWSRRLGPSGQDRDRVGRRDLVATARCVATSAVRLLSSGRARAGRRRRGGVRMGCEALWAGRLGPKCSQVLCLRTRQGYVSHSKHDGPGGRIHVAAIWQSLSVWLPHVMRWAVS
ncbi:hypothetical protein Taro_030117 [Colocasia esculenta]|uniref:Uncharacterized protein n=1 Tax=Colocasia esculenta TaxID=4460 RepID=A0A843VN57_COLES|nr:hypothetical protein [Colocasia esculenta]